MSLEGLTLAELQASRSAVLGFRIPPTQLVDRSYPNLRDRGPPPLLFISSLPSRSEGNEEMKTGTSVRPCVG